LLRKGKKKRKKILRRDLKGRIPIKTKKKKKKKKREGKEEENRKRSHRKSPGGYEQVQPSFTISSKR